MKSYSVTAEKTRIQWALKASECQQQPIKYYVRIKESSGRLEHYGPLSKDNWEIRQKIKLDDLCVFAKYGTKDEKNGPCSKSLFTSQIDDITEGTIPSNQAQI